jgi:hypothetical protein
MFDSEAAATSRLLRLRSQIPPENVRLCLSIALHELLRTPAAAQYGHSAEWLTRDGGSEG